MWPRTRRGTRPRPRTPASTTKTSARQGTGPGTKTDGNFHQAGNRAGDAKANNKTKETKEHKAEAKEDAKANDSKAEAKDKDTGINYQDFGQAGNRASNFKTKTDGDFHQAGNSAGDRSEGTGDGDFQTKAEDESKGTGKDFSCYHQAEDKFDTKAHQEKTRDDTKAKTRTETGGNMSLRCETEPRAGGEEGKLGNTQVLISPTS